MSKKTQKRHATTKALKRHATTVALVESAKNGDRQALDQLIKRCYDVWLRKYHGALGGVLRCRYGTEDLVHSAIADVIRDLPALRSNEAFHSWVNTIIRHTIVKWRRKAKAEEEALPDVCHSKAPSNGDGKAAEMRALADEEYFQTLDAMLALFPRHPEEMAAVYLKFLEGCDIHEMVTRLHRPRETVFRWLRCGTRRLKRRLAP